MRKIRFWLSKLIFEQIFKWPSAQKIGEKIKLEVRTKSLDIKAECENCGSGKLIEECSGSDGLFCWPHYYYRCQGCGHLQESKYKFELLSQKLAEKRIIEDGEGTYRYTIFTEIQWVLIFTLIIFVMAVGFALLLKKYISI